MFPFATQLVMQLPDFKELLGSGTERRFYAHEDNADVVLLGTRQFLHGSLGYASVELVKCVPSPCSGPIGRPTEVCGTKGLSAHAAIREAVLGCEFDARQLGRLPCLTTQLWCNDDKIATGAR